METFRTFTLMNSSFPNYEAVHCLITVPESCLAPALVCCQACMPVKIFRSSVPLYGHRKPTTMHALHFCLQMHCHIMSICLHLSCTCILDIYLFFAMFIYLLLLSACLALLTRMIAYTEYPAICACYNYGMTLSSVLKSSSVLLYF